jgi:hypothetical protein
MRAHVVAEFATPQAMLEAVDLLRRRGYQGLETYSPYPMSEIPARLGLPRSTLPRLAFAGGVFGAIAGYGIQWYTSVYDYPLNIGGRPVHSAPAFIPITFETLVLCAALAAFVGLLVAIGLPALWHPVFEVDGFERASADRYWVGVEREGDGPDLGSIEEVLVPLRPLRVVRVETGP